MGYELIEIVAAAIMLIYLWLEYKASIWLWIVGFFMQALDIILYYQKGLYADCAMEFYYIAMTIYGLWTWKFGHKRQPGTHKELAITHFSRRYILPWTLATLAAWAALWYWLTRIGSTVPVADAFTTALSFVGIWALARKYLEQWLIWIVVDVVTCALYFYKDIPFKASLYALYVVIAAFGYMKWRARMQTN
mgnify:FL=1